MAANDDRELRATLAQALVELKGALEDGLESTRKLHKVETTLLRLTIQAEAWARLIDGNGRRPMSDRLVYLENAAKVSRSNWQHWTTLAIAVGGNLLVFLLVRGG